MYILYIVNIYCEKCTISESNMHFNHGPISYILALLWTHNNSTFLYIFF